MWRDDYTNFSFDELQSENFKVWITNNNDLKRNMSPNFSDKFNSPTYGQTRHHEGTTIDKQDFKFSCVAVDVTLNEWRAITEWLSPLKSGKLRFDWNDKYYYMVKLSKAPSGTIFVRSKVDKVLGQLYIITFDLEFTTVNDWAALGYYAEQTKDQDINVSVYNNSYYMPTIIQNKSSDTKNFDVTDQIVFPAGGKMTITTQTDFSNGTDGRLFDIYGYSPSGQIPSLIGQIVWNQDEGQDTWYLCYAHLDDNRTVFWQEKLNYDNKTFTIDLTNAIFCNRMSSSGGTWNVKIEYNTPEWIIHNTGTYDIFPLFYFNMPVNSEYDITVNKNGQNYYSILRTLEKLYRPLFVTINSRTNTILANGVLAFKSRNFKGLKLFKKVQSNDILAIESGKPELIKAILVSDSPMKIYDGSEYVDVKDYREAIFLINNKPLYPRYSSFSLHAFTEDLVEEVNKYDKDTYDNKMYFSNIENKKRLMLNSPFIVYEQTTKGWLMKVYYYTNTNHNGYGTSFSNSSFTEEIENADDKTYFSFKGLESKAIYISLCNYSSLDITYGGTFSIGIQPREVI